MRIPLCSKKNRAMNFFKQSFRCRISALLVGGTLLGSADPAFALQVHPAPEGLYAHQLAHLFFILTMGLFAFWLKKRGLAEHPGWRCIRISCFLFILWNLGAFLGHTMDSGLTDAAFTGNGWDRKLLTEAVAYPYVYYFLKLDHLFSVPAILALYLGLKRLRKDAGDHAA